MSSQDELDLLAPHNKCDDADRIIYVGKYQETHLSTIDGTCDSATEQSVGRREPLHGGGEAGSHSITKERRTGKQQLVGGDDGAADGVHSTSLSTTEPIDISGLDIPEGGIRESTPPRDSRHGERISVEDTPARSHTTHSRSYQTGNLSDMRLAVSQHVGTKALEIPLKHFIKQLLPPLKHDFSIPVILRLLRDDGVVSDCDQVLTDFDDEPKKRKEREEDVLAPLARIFEKICQLASPRTVGVEVGQFLGMVPNYEPFSEVSMKHRPDGGFFPTSKREFVDKAVSVKGETEADKLDRVRTLKAMKLEGKHITFHDILVPLEGKKHLSGRDDNVGKMIFHGQQLLAHDPCRRFVLGISIENTDMHLWFMSRTAPIVSEGFNFTTEIARLIRVVLSLSFASWQQLGYDPTIRPIQGGEDQQYSIEVGARTFRTRKIIASIKAHALMSTGTRVWVCTEETEGGSERTFIVKDSWIEHDRLSERHIVEAILQDVEQQRGMPARKKAALHLLIPVTDCMVEIDHEIDCTKDIDAISSDYKQFLLKIPKDHANQPGSRGAGPPGSHDISDDIDSASPAQPRPRRKHYRAVYDKLGTPLFTVKKISDAFLVLMDSTKCLQFIHECGWIHRDISSANLYLYQGRGLVGDLEYARRKDSKNVAHDMFTSRLDYMATETIARRYAFVKVVESSGRPPFAHNELHDLESSWWTAVYVIFFMLDIDVNDELDDKELRDKSQKREAVRQALFPGSHNYDARSSFLTQRAVFLDYLSWLPDCLMDIRTALGVARERLILCYGQFEENFSGSYFEELYTAFIYCFQRCRAVAIGLQEAYGASLILRHFLERSAASAADAQVHAEDAEDSDDHQVVTRKVTRNNPGPSSGHGRKGQKRHRSPEGEARVTLRRRSDKHTEFIQGSSEHLAI